jgi:hypothetical protein
MNLGLFDNSGPEHIELTLLRRLVADHADLTHQVLHLRYRVEYG